MFTVAESDVSTAAVLSADRLVNAARCDMDVTGLRDVYYQICQKITAPDSNSTTQSRRSTELQEHTSRWGGDVA